jgi:DNA-binding FadR family transcriptional regulator
MQTESAKSRRYEHVVRHLEEAMLSGELAPGDRLPSERALMATFGVGRGSVREALFALQKMGLVALAAGERAHVTRPTAKNLVRELSGAARQLLAAPDGVRHFQEARQLLECALAREAASRVTPDRLRLLFAAMEDHRLARQRERAIAADMLFHYRIAEASGNPVLIALHTALGEWLREQRATSVQARGAKAAAALAHRRVYDAIAARDPDAAAAAMQSHLQEVEAFYWEAVPSASTLLAPSPARRRQPRAASD